MKLIDHPVVLNEGRIEEASVQDRESGLSKTIAHRILAAHNTVKDDGLLHLSFDSLTSHDITYVSIIQTAIASGMKSFPVPYVLTNCHNSLCAVGGTINEDDHRFAFSAAQKFGGIYVPALFGVIHSYNREMMTGGGRMILGSDSHTRYGALGTMGIGEGGGELVKQLLNKTYDIAYPPVVLIYLTGRPKKGVGPHDVALALIRETYDSGFVKNCVLEFAGPGIHELSQDFRNGIDVMTTETTCLSSIWVTDEITEEYYRAHSRPDDYKELKTESGAYYDRSIELDLSEIECMIALPMHPSYAVAINELKKDPHKYLKEAQERCNSQLNGSVNVDLLSKIDGQGNLHADQAVIAGCAGGTFENIAAASAIMKDHSIGTGGFRLSVYPDSQLVNREIARTGILTDLLDCGAVYREPFCGPCFGAGDTPANNELSLRHTTRNFPNREGSKPAEGQIALVALMDARSIAATAANGGILRAASDLDTEISIPTPAYDTAIYERRVFNGYGHPDDDAELVYGPNIKPWPTIPELSADLLVKIVSYIDDPVTTTDELIPSGETSSYRSNPERLAEFTLSRRDPDYVSEAKAVRDLKCVTDIPDSVRELINEHPQMNIGSAIYANRPGDGSAREQAASCQRVLGGAANFALDYATKRYRSNCINWGILPFVIQDRTLVEKGDWVFIPGIREAIASSTVIRAEVYGNNAVRSIQLDLGELTDEERQILSDGCLMNYYRRKGGSR